VTDQEETGLLAVAALVARGAEPDSVFAAAAEQAANLTGGDATAVLRYLGAERAVVVGTWRAGGTRGMPVNAEIDFHPAHSAVGIARSTRAPARLDSYEGARGELPVIMKSIGLRSSVAAPVFAGEDVWGVVVASSATDEPLPPGCEERLTGIAQLVGHAVDAALERRRLDESRLRLVEAADEDRRRLERKLHEGYQQHILALTVKLRAARSGAEEGSQLAGLLDAALEDTEHANATLRELARALYPAVLRERGLAAALQALAARSALPVVLRELPRRRFAPVLEATVYFIVTEALANAAAHSGASDAHVTVAYRRDHLVVEVRDEGAGGAEPRRGSGLEALADRAAAVGAQLELESPRGGGTVVRAEIPLGD
jgi:signal transduction histidine kinase